MANTRESLDEVRWMAPEVVSPPSFSSESDGRDVQEGEMSSDPYKLTPASDVYSFGMTTLEVRS
jgi:serine/threonine protein kinase